MSSKLPAVSVIIPARHAGEALARALDSIEAQTYPNVLEVIVAAADEASARSAAGRAEVVMNPSGATPTGLNLAIAASNGEIIVRCDTHAVLPPAYVAVAVATMQRTGAANVGGMQVPVGQTAWEDAIAVAMSSPWGAGDARYRVGGEEGPAETVYLGVFRRETLETVGGFDDDFARTQDYELNHRIIASGGLVWFDPELKVDYRPRGSLRSLATQYFQYGRAKRQFNRKHPGSLRWRQIAAPLLVGVLGVSLLGSILAPVLLLVPGVYAVGLIVAAAGAGQSFWRVASALAVMHLSWGTGFLIS